MVTCYPGGGAAYGPHIDNADGDGREELDYGRCFTAVLYLNPRWERADGGALRIYLPSQGDAPQDPHLSLQSRLAWLRLINSAQATSMRPIPHTCACPLGPDVEERHVVELLPHGDTLILFRADRIVHEVCASHAARLALTFWMYAGTREQAAAQRAEH